MINLESSGESRKHKTSRFLTVSAFLFSSFLFLTISASNGIATILFYKMVGQLNPVLNAPTSNNKSYYSNISSNALTDTNVVHTSWVLAIILSLAFPQVYTMLSSFWMKCHKRKNKKKTHDNETENTNEDSNNNDDKRRTCEDWVLMIFSSIKAAIWTLFIFCYLPRVDPVTGFSTVILLQTLLIMSPKYMNRRLGTKYDNVIRIIACIVCFLMFATIILIQLLNSTIGTADKVTTSVAFLNMLVAIIEVVVPLCNCKNRIAPCASYLFDQSTSNTFRKNREKFHIVLSIVHLGVIVLFAAIACTIYCEQPFGFFKPTMKCRYGDYDTYFTWNGDATEPISFAVLIILLSFVCFKMCYYACAINVQVFGCYVPLLLSTFATLVSMACFSHFETTIFGCMILPNKFNEETEMSVQLSVPGSAAAVAIVCVFLLVFSHRKNLVKRMEEQKSFFQYPYFQSVGIGLSILQSRVSYLSNLEEQYRADSTRNENNTTKRHIYVCSTMMRERKKEMKKLVSSILRLQRNSSDECTYEAHIIFDDAFNEEQPNEYVKRLEKVIEKDLQQNASQSQQNNTNQQQTSQSQQNDNWYQKIEYPTPYGCKYEYLKKEEQEYTPLISVHLKNKNKIRMKKRWSQVMYMLFFLRFKQKKEDLENCFILTLDGDVDFEPKAVERLKELLDRDSHVGAACGRIFPEGMGPMIWYQKFEYAASHWLQKSTEHVYGCCLCSPGCFSLFRGSALDEVLDTYTKKPKKALHHIQYDLGEDRWLCTLLLKQGYKVEYMSAATAKTFAPQTFLEFCKQRRRWTPSTLANILDVIWLKSKEVRQMNPYINKLYLLYQTYLLVSSVVTPGTIFLVILGALVTAFPELPLWVALLLNVIPIAILMIICVMTDKDEIPIYYSGVLSTVYSLLMIVLLIGLIIEAKQSDFCSISTFFFAFVVGVFFLSALLHPTEFKYLFYGAMYFFAVPAVSMILVIYILGSLHILRWGTREKRSDYVLDDDKLSLLDRCCGRQRDERGADEFLLLCNESNSPVGKKIEIRCNRRVPPYCNVVWKKDAREINNNDRRIDMVNYGFPKLVISNAKISDSGSYTCDVTQISGGQIEFKPCNVAIKGKKGKEAVRLSTNSGTNTIVEGHDDEIVCKISENIDNETIWKKDSTIISVQDNKYPIKDATKSMAGTYSCEVKFKPSEDSITIGKSKVNKEGHYITFKPRDSQQGEESDEISAVWKVDDKTAEHFGNSVDIDEETNLKIDIDNWNTDKFNVSRTVKNEKITITDKFEVCKQNGKFKITEKSYKRILKSSRNVLIDSEITWKENDTNIDDIQEAVVKQKKKTGNITITEPKKENCTYTCAIKHQPKSDSIAIEIVKPSLIMEGPDLILLDLNNSESNNGAIKEITCKTTAKKLKDVKWKKDNAEINTEDQKQSLSLKIENANRKHAGRYTCRVETSTGTVLEASKSIGCELDFNETEEWHKLIKEYLSPDEESFEKQKEVHELMLSLRNNVYFLFFLINALFVTSIFMMTQVNEFKGNIQISIPCPNKDGMFEVEPISMIFIFTFGLTLLLQLIGMVIHRFNTFLHLAYDIFSHKGGSQTAQHENA